MWREHLVVAIVVIVVSVFLGRLVLFFQHYCCDNVGQKRIIVVLLFLLPLLLFGQTWKLDRSGLLCWWWRLVERPKVSAPTSALATWSTSSAIMSGKSATLAESKSSRFHRRGRRPGAPCWSPPMSEEAAQNLELTEVDVPTLGDLGSVEVW